MNTGFHRALKRFLIEAFTDNKLSPSNVCNVLLKSIYRPCGKENKEIVNKILSDRGIQYLVHFTPLKNVRGIARYGLIPRNYLSSEVIKMELGPLFPDNNRFDGLTEYSCLSVTSPNYKMFYSKRQIKKSSRWAVVIYPAEVLTKFWSKSCSTNAAGEAPVISGGKGISSLFILPSIRKDLKLTYNQPTDPQAEVLCDSVLLPSEIISIHVESAEDKDYLKASGIESTINPSMFKPRHDYNFWKDKRITDLPGFGSELEVIEGFENG